MCIAIYQPADTEDLSKETLKTCWKNNQDSMGFMYAENGHIETYRTLKRFSKFVKQYRRVREKGVDMVLHFRIGTHGDDTIDNCHPFKVNKHLYFVHNGIIDATTPGPKDSRSDTRIFNDRILKKLPNNWLEKECFVELVAEYIGYSKLVFMDSEGDVSLINPELGEWDKQGIWYSNDSYKPPKPPKPMVNRRSSSKTYVHNPKENWKPKGKLELAFFTNTEYIEEADWQPINLTNCKEHGRNDDGETVEEMYDRLWEQRLEEEEEEKEGEIIDRPQQGYVWRSEIYCEWCLPINSHPQEYEPLHFDNAPCSICHAPLKGEM